MPRYSSNLSMEQRRENANILDELKMGMVVGFKSDGSFINKRITAYQEAIGFDVDSASITHVGISMGGPYIVEATFPKSRAANLLEDYQGRELIFLYYKNQIFRDCKRKNVTVWAATRCNLNYGWPALLGFYLASLIPIWGDNPLSSKRTPFCSYLVAWAFRRVGFDPFPGTATDLITPAHFAASDQFEHLGLYVGRDYSLKRTRGGFGAGLRAVCGSGSGH